MSVAKLSAIEITCAACGRRGITLEIEDEQLLLFKGKCSECGEQWTLSGTDGIPDKEKPPFDLTAALREHAANEAEAYNSEIQEALDKGWTITEDDLPDSDEIYSRYMNASNPSDHIMDLLERDGIHDKSDTREYFDDCVAADMFYRMAVEWLNEQDE